MLCTDWLDHSPGAVEAAATEPVCDVDGRQLYLSVPHHDGGYDVRETGTGTVWDQRRSVSKFNTSTSDFSKCTRLQFCYFGAIRCS